VQNSECEVVGSTNTLYRRMGGGGVMVSESWILFLFWILRYVQFSGCVVSDEILASSEESG
jgi:hypothetical protein